MHATLSVVDRGQTKPKTITLACMLAFSVVDRGQTKPYTITIQGRLAFSEVESSQNPQIEEQTRQWSEEQGKITIYKALHGKLKIEQHEPH
jgi:hypothetical protein